VGVDPWVLVGAGILLVLIGFALIFLGVLGAAVGGGGGGKGRVEGGGVIMIGPIPIIFGTSSKMAVIAAVLAVVLIVLALILMRGAGQIVQAPH